MLDDAPLPVVALPLPDVPDVVPVVPLPDVPDVVLPLIDELPLPIFAFARTKRSLLLLLALLLLVALPLVPVAPLVESPRSTQPVTVTVPWLLVCAVVGVCAAILTPNASAAAATAPVQICRFM